MDPIKETVLAYMHKSGTGENKETSVPALDRYLVYVKHEEEYVGGRLLTILQQMIDDGLLVKGAGSAIALTEQGQAIPMNF